jgi:BMFP domain-containing protein YqiC
MARRPWLDALRQCDLRRPRYMRPCFIGESHEFHEFHRFGRSVRAFGRDLEGNFKAVLQAQLAKLDLVSRQEFDVQAAVLARTQAQLTALGERLQQLEAKLSPQPPSPSPSPSTP